MKTMDEEKIERRNFFGKKTQKSSPVQKCEIVRTQRANERSMELRFIQVIKFVEKGSQSKDMLKSVLNIEDEKSLLEENIAL